MKSRFMWTLIDVMLFLMLCAMATLCAIKYIDIQQDESAWREFIEWHTLYEDENYDEEHDINIINLDDISNRDWEEYEP